VKTEGLLGGITGNGGGFMWNRKPTPAFPPCSLDRPNPAVIYRPLCFGDVSRAPFVPIDRLRGFGLFKLVMTKEKLIEIIKTLLKTDADLGFLFQLKEKELEKLVACIRRRTDQIGK